MRLLESLLLSCTLLLCGRGALAQAVDVFVQPANQNVTVGENVMVEIRLDTNGLNVGGGGVFLQFDTARLSFVNGANNTATWNLGFVNVEPSETQTGIVSLSVGASSAVNANGVLVSTLNFTADAPGVASLVLLNNPGMEETVFTAPNLITLLPTNRTNGSVTVAAQLSGQVRYYSSNGPVPSVTVDLIGGTPASVMTGGGGSFSFSGIVEENKILQPSKSGGFSNGVSSLDASRALQSSIDLITLSQNQALACDVTGNGTVTSLDASRILQFQVGLITQFPIAQACGSDWLFRPMPAPAANQTLIEPVPLSSGCQPGGISYQPLDAPAAGQDFIAILFGDCTGNWTP